MLILGSKLKSTPIMSLQTGSQLAVSGDAIIDPANLEILAYKLENNVYSKDECFLRIADIRELSRLGFIIDSGEDFIQKDDVIRIKNILDLNFQLLGIKVVDTKGQNIGKVIDFSFSLMNFTVQQIIVKQPLFKRFSAPELIIHRNMVTEIDDEKITIKSNTEPEELKRQKQGENFVPNYINPFRD